MASSAENYDAQIAALALKESSFEQKYRSGAKWAKGHADKYRKQGAQLLSKKTNAIAALKSDQTKKLEDWRKRILRYFKFTLCSSPPDSKGGLFIYSFSHDFILLLKSKRITQNS